MDASETVQLSARLDQSHEVQQPVTLISRSTVQQDKIKFIDGSSAMLVPCVYIFLMNA